MASSGSVFERPDAADHRKCGGDQHQHQVAGRPGDEPGDHLPGLLQRRSRQGLQGGC